MPLDGWMQKCRQLEQKIDVIRSETIEECAKVAENYLPWSEDASRAFRIAASAIRALKEKL